MNDSAQKSGESVFSPSHVLQPQSTLWNHWRLFTHVLIHTITKLLGRNHSKIKKAQLILSQVLSCINGKEV